VLVIVIHKFLTHRNLTQIMYRGTLQGRTLN